MSSSNKLIDNTEKQIIPNCTLTTACFNLSKYNNGCLSLSKTISNIEPLLKLYCYLVIYTDNICIDFIREIRGVYNNITKYIVINFEDLPTYKYLEIIKKNREIYHPTKDERTCAESHLICSSKFYFVRQVIDFNPFNTDKFGWIDSNVRENFSKICENYTDEMLLNILHTNDDKFHINILNVVDKKYKLPENKKEFYERYRYIVCGSFFTTGKEVGIKILNRLDEIFFTTTMMGYGHGEEMYYLEVLDEFYDDIKKGYSDYGQIINNFIHPVTNLHYIYDRIIANYYNLKYYREAYDCCHSIVCSIENISIENISIENISIENIKINEDLYMKILFIYYMSSLVLHENLENNFLDKVIHPLKIIEIIYKICEEEKMKEEFNKKKFHYEYNFSFSNKFKN